MAGDGRKSRSSVRDNARGTRCGRNGRGDSALRYGAARGLGDERDRLHTLAPDITDAEAAHLVAAETAARFGAIEILVNNAGYGELGFFETFTDAAVRRRFEVNLFGTVRPRHHCLVGQWIGLKRRGAEYSPSKFALEGWMGGFAQELAPHGIRSLVVEPGMLRTDFMDGKSPSFGSIDIPDYAEATALSRRRGWGHW